MTACVIYYPVLYAQLILNLLLFGGSVHVDVHLVEHDIVLTYSVMLLISLPEACQNRLFPYRVPLGLQEPLTRDTLVSHYHAMCHYMTPYHTVLHHPLPAPLVLTLTHVNDQFGDKSVVLRYTLGSWHVLIID